MEQKPEKRGLGRGLSALMADVALGGTAAGSDQLRKITTLVPIEKLRANPLQPRRDFDPAALEDLSASIRAKGVLQPLIVRPSGRDGTYEIVAGERRWRAAQMAQVHELPVISRDLDDTEVLEIAIIENIQREDLNAIEEAMGFRQLMDRFGHTQERMAEALSKSRSHIANLLRLLTLPDGVQDMVRQGRLSAGHARALITSPNPLELAQIVLDRGLSVRETESLARTAQPTRDARARRTARVQDKDADTRALEADLSANLGMSVQIAHEIGGSTGVMSIRYNTLDDLDRLCRGLSMLPALDAM
ncbi:MAG: ParB/RepB/Spo0J family partition protein [Pseudomonadota bacterium]